MFKKVVLCLCLIFSIMVLGVACTRVIKGESKLFVANFDYNISASCDENEVVLDISNKKTATLELGEALDVVMLKPFEYYSGETDIGVNFQTVQNQEGQVVGQYFVGQEETLTLPRYDDEGYDNLYNKFLLAKDGEMVAGPFFVSDIQSERNYQSLVATTKKGIIIQGDEQTLVDLGCGWTEYNVLLNQWIFPNEMVDEAGNIVPIDNSGLSSEVAIEFVSNGTTYYFRKDVVDTYDNSLIFCRDNNIKVLFICYFGRIYDQTYSPYFMTYPSVRDYTKGHLWAGDTSTELGMGYNVAVWEFLAERYSREDEQFGHADRFVVGNEIDISWDWNPVVNYDTTEALPLEQYVEEYTRQLRIAEQATKKYYSENMVLVSTCHYWVGAKDKDGAYGSKQIYDYLNAKISYQGNFNWGMASHPYPVSLSDSAFLTSETKLNSVNGDVDDSVYITWTNLELLDLYLARNELLFNGQMRRVFLTEGGVSSGYYEAPNAERLLNNQAAGVAYAYYKSMSLDCVEAFIYYKLVDSAGDGGGCNFGILTDTLAVKPSYQVFKYMDTQYSFVVSNEYLKYLKYKINDVNYGTTYGNVTCYYDTMDLVKSGFDWKSQWDESKIISRTIDPVEELEQILNQIEGE